MHRSVKLLFATALLVAVWFTWGTATPASAQQYSYGRNTGRYSLYKPYGGYTYIPYSTYLNGNGFTYGPYPRHSYGARYRYGSPVYSPYGNPYRGYIYTPFGDRF